MRLPWTLSAYIGRHFLQSILLALFGLLALSMLVDIVELLRRASGREAVPFIVILQMSALKLPSMPKSWCLMRCSSAACSRSRA